MKHELQQRTIGILSRCMDTTIATIRPDGSPQATVSFVPTACCYISAASFFLDVRFNHYRAV